MWGTARAKDVRDLVFAEVEQYRRQLACAGILPGR